MFIAPVKSEVSKKIGQNVREIRKRSGLTQRDLAEAMSRLGFPMDKAKVSRLENGSGVFVDVAKLMALASSLQIEPLVLLREPGWSKFPWASEIDRQAVGQ
jgi:transcriptional regulator with XRE-family HTH domain